MAELRIVTDSAASIPPQKAREWGVEVLPLRVHLGDEVYREGVDIQPQKLLEKLAATDTVPTVSPPPVEEFVAVYGRLSRTTEGILSLHVSRRICDVLPVVRQASQEFLGRCRVTVVDSTVFDLGQRILVERAVRAARAGLGVQEVVRIVRGLIPRLYAIFFTENLNYLERGKRLGPAQAILGTMLGIKPILTLEEGDLLPLEKVRTRERALEKLTEFVAEFSHVEEIAILQGGSPEDAQALREMLASILSGREIPISTCGPSLAVHLGPSAMGVIVFEGE